MLGWANHRSNLGAGAGWSGRARRRALPHVAPPMAKLEGEMQIPGETAAPLIKRVGGWGERWGDLGGLGEGPGPAEPRKGVAEAPGEGARASGDLH
jgi:hypothetical protein